MPVTWFSEACDCRPDPETGVQIVQLTYSPQVSNTIYCEQPYGTPDGKRVAFVRGRDFSLDPVRTLMVADLETLRIAVIEDGFTPGQGSGSVGNASWSGLLHYWIDADLYRADMTTMTRQIVVNHCGAPGPRVVQSVSPDQRYAIYRVTLPGPTNGIVRVDMTDGSWRVIFEHPEITNPHLQFNPVHGRDILVQHNRGSSLDPDHRPTEREARLGTTLFVIDADGSNQRPLPVGEPITSTATGHETFVADTGRICFTTHWNRETWELDVRWPQGNLFTAAPGDDKPTVFEAPEHRFNHVCVSKCGRYFLADSHPEGLFGPVALVMGAFATGRYRTLLDDCGAHSGGSQHSHSHAFLTADNRHAIFNRAPLGGVPQVCAARIPPAFLDSLG